MSPLNSYYITSKFGKRRDPVNKRWSSHYGLDMGGVLKSNIYATSPGVVVFADISQMMVKCEVYEGDLGKIKIGQNATISGKSLKGDIKGKVVQIGREIDVARKVATLWVSLKNSIDAGKYIGMEVSVSILP